MKNKILQFVMILALLIILIEGFYVSYHFVLLDNAQLIALLGVGLMFSSLIFLFIIYPIGMGYITEIKQLKELYRKEIDKSNLLNDKLVKLQDRLNEYRLLLDIKTSDDTIGKFKDDPKTYQRPPTYLIILAKFIGRNESAGYVKDKNYKLLVNDNTIKRLDGSGVVSYSSVDSFLKNWKLVNFIDK